MEITARDLSYKNLINHKELGTVEVVGFNEEIIQYLHLDTIYYDEYSKLEAIKLTEEWLLKFPKIDWIQCDDLGYFFVFKDKKIRLMFVHSLQNTYFYIEQKELLCENI